jgi:hypothetical protein
MNHLKQTISFIQHFIFEIIVSTYFDKLLRNISSYDIFI